MFSVRFRRVRRSRSRVRRRNNLCLSRQNLTKNIWVWGNVLDDLSMTLTQGHGCGID